MLTWKMAKTQTLEREARRLGRYLVGDDLPQELVERYQEANLALFPERPSAADGAILEFVRRHPWSLAPRESALGQIPPDALLRRKLVVMMAILETEPRFAGDFEALAPGRPGAVLRLMGLGLSSAAKVTAGILLYPFARSPGARGPESPDGPGA